MVLAAPVTPVPPRTLRRALAVSVVDGGLYGVMIGVSESYLGALAVELGHGDMALAVLASVPMLLGSLAQLAAGPLASALGGRRRLVVAGAALQAACQLGLLVIAATQDRRLWTLLAVKSVFWIAGSAIAPAWNAWMAVLTADISRERYFARRSSIVYLMLLAAYVGAGLHLETGRLAGAVLPAFQLLFVVAFAARLLSAVALRVQAEPADPEGAPSGGTRGRLAQAVRTSSWRVAAYVAAVTFAAWVSGPFFTPYMLHTLRLDFTTYALLTAVAIMVKAIVFPLYHRVSDRLGMLRTLAVAGAGVVLIPVAWSQIRHVPGLMVVEVFSGVAWAGVEFASFQLLLRASPDSCRVEFFSLANAASGLAQVLGGVAGGLVLARLDREYPDVFLLSALLRAGALTLLSVTAMRFAARGPLPRLLTRIVSVRPMAGVERRPVVHDDDGPGRPYGPA